MIGTGSTRFSETGGGRLIRVARERAAISQSELARRMGAHQQTISRWERGRLKPSFEHVIQAVGACGWDLILALTLQTAAEAELQKPMRQRTTPEPMAATVELLGVDGSNPGERRMQGLASMRARRAELRAISERREPTLGRRPALPAAPSDPAPD